MIYRRKTDPELACSCFGHISTEKNKKNLRKSGYMECVVVLIYVTTR